MRAISFGGMLLSSIAAVAVESARATSSVPHMGYTRYPAGWSKSGNGFHPRLNRHNYQPHEHRREIARRQRQAGVVA